MSKASNLIANLRGFLAAADPAGRVHPQVNTLRAKTARMSITGPALQTLKKHDPRLRRCFTADPGHVLISCDFSQVEIRVAAALAEDPTLKQVILSGADIHDATAALMYGEGFTDEQRTISKRATFGTIYGGGARALASQTGVTEDTARQVIQRWRRTYPRVIAYGRRLAELAEVVTASGRRIPADPARPYANANYAVQSTARDLLLAAVYTLVTRYQVGGLWLFVHDEIIVQAPEHDAERVRGLLERAMTSTFRGLPIVAEAKILGPAWGQHDPAAPAPGKSGTSGTSGTCAGQTGPAGSAGCRGSGTSGTCGTFPASGCWSPVPAPGPMKAIAAALRQHWDGPPCWSPVPARAARTPSPNGYGHMGRPGRTPPRRLGQRPGRGHAPQRRDGRLGADVAWPSSAITAPARATPPALLSKPVSRPPLHPPAGGHHAHSHRPTARRPC